MIVSVEDSSHPITILHLQLYLLVQEQHLHHLDVPRTHSQHEGGEVCREGQHKLMDIHWLKTSSLTHPVINLRVSSLVPRLG